MNNLEFNRMNVFNTEKAVQLLNFFAIQEKCTIDKMKAIKLVWLTDRLHFRKCDSLITNDTYFALPFGPVASGTRNILDNQIHECGSYASEYINSICRLEYRSIADIDKNVFSGSELETIRTIWEAYGSWDRFDLSEESHKSPEWKKFQRILENRLSRCEKIDIQDFHRDFEDSKEIFADI